ncbi:MAG: beta-lactamase family protein [candidate division Zixibacteria bacterium]|nr:beta-lactamase family protein [candidate division Zixibacteria bacterium]
MKRIIIFIILIPSFLCSQELGVKEKIDEYLEQTEKVWEFQGSVLVAKSDVIIYDDVYGMANLKDKKRNTTTTKFLIGSVTKSFTAIAIMQLVEKGVLNLDHPISSYLKNYSVDNWRKITIRHLLSHTSGIPVFSMLPDFRKKAMLSSSVNDIVDLFKDEPLIFEPGTKQQYGSPGYLLLGIIIEDVTGLTYQDYIKQHISNIAGMSETDICEDYKSRPDFAIGYFKEARGKLIEAEPMIFPVAFSAGALSSTTHDLYLLDCALNGDILLNANSLEIMLNSEKGEYGLGFNIRNLAGHKIAGHDGTAPGFCATFQRWLDDSLCVVILSNNASLPLPIFNIADALAAIVLNERYELPLLKHPIPLEIDQLTEYEGVYQEKNDTYHVIGLVGHRLAERNNYGIVKPILPESEDIFYYEQDLTATIRFSRDGEGNISQLISKKLFDERVAHKLGEAKADSIACAGSIVSVPTSVLNIYEGSYQFSPEAPNWNIFVNENRLFARAAGLPAIELLPLSETTFCIRSLGTRVMFNYDDNNTVIGITYIDQGTKRNARRISKSN